MKFLQQNGIGDVLSILLRSLPELFLRRIAIHRADLEETVCAITKQSICWRSCQAEFGDHRLELTSEFRRRIAEIAGVRLDNAPIVNQAASRQHTDEQGDAQSPTDNRTYPRVLMKPDTLPSAYRDTMSPKWRNAVCSASVIINVSESVQINFAFYEQKYIKSNKLKVAVVVLFSFQISIDD